MDNSTTTKLQNLNDEMQKQIILLSSAGSIEYKDFHAEILENLIGEMRELLIKSPANKEKSDKAYKLHELLSGIADENRHEEKTTDIQGGELI